MMEYVESKENPLVQLLENTSMTETHHYFRQLRIRSETHQIERIIAQNIEQ
jgi:hypothetical protein